MQGGEQVESKGLFSQAVPDWPCTIPSRAGGDAWLDPTRTGMVWLLPGVKGGVGVLQLLIVEQNCKYR